jgi:hypothetical protein
MIVPRPNCSRRHKGQMRRNRYRRMHVGLPGQRLERINKIRFKLDVGCEFIGDYPGQFKRN